MYNYEIDDSDRIVFTCPNWLTFAAENAAPQLMETGVLETPIWSYIADDDCRTVYRMLFTKVRAHGSSLVVPFRCDSPTLNRFMKLTISLQDHGNLQLTARLVRAEPRPYQALLDPSIKRSDEFVTICSWCKKVKHPPGAWLAIDEAVQKMRLFLRPEMPNLTHGMCPKCFNTAMQEVALQ